MANLDQVIGHVVQNVEKQLDEHLTNFENLTSDDLDALRKQRIQQLKEEAAKKLDFKKKGHGAVIELSAEKEFFDTCKNSEKCIIFISDDTKDMTKILNHHLNIVAKKYLELKIAKINVKYCPFLKERFNLTATPALILIKDYKVVQKNTIFPMLEDIGTASTIQLMRLIGNTGLIDIEGLPSPTMKKKQNILRKTVRDDDSDDLDSD